MEIEQRIEDGVAIITLNAPERRNALTPAMAELLWKTLDDAERNPSIGALVLTGGESFCAGANLTTLSEASNDPAGDVMYSALSQIYASFTKFGSLRVPTIAAVRGYAVGAGLNLAMAADVRIVSGSCVLRSGFARIGLHPGGGHISLIARASSPETAAAMVLFGEDVDGNRAVDLGLAWAVVADNEVESRAVELARRASKDRALARAVTGSYRLETASPGMAWEAAVQAERASQIWSMRRSQT